MKLETVLDLLSDLTLLKYFPGEPAARLALAKLVLQMATTGEQIEWLVARTLSVCNEWPGPLVLRQIFCSRFKPRDGIEAGSTALFPEGVPSPRPIEAPPMKALPAGHAMQKTIQAAAAQKSLEAAVYDSPPDYRHLEELRRARLRREHREVMEAMGVKPITQADIERALLESRAKRSLENHDPHSHKTH